MKILVDTHTHTNCSTHAFGTIMENLAMAKKRGLEMLCMTDHAPALPDAPHIWHFQTMHELPREVDGVKLLFGVEANILDVQGHLDIPESMQDQMEVMVASIHAPCYPPKTVEEHTQTWLHVLQNPYVTILGHSGHPSFPYDYETVAEAAKKYNKCIEINNHSFSVRHGSRENCMKIAEVCKKIGTKIVVSSDAHNSFQIGVFDHALELLKEVDFPEEQIMNLTAARFTDYLKELRG
ncbi:phosphatase [Ructibacterium gallinarum]|uniref:Phosphatase n=1 Tax=Ructibacterium gallinarum TaxID=2779355 RepID=A0A9D5R7X9_9FIRM|nr:phosphatase [Ructibacterium gallinarum]MBE5039355.1 phosphatase [Ructibacterium gallinarum]